LPFLLFGPGSIRPQLWHTKEERVSPYFFLAGVLIETSNQHGRTHHTKDYTGEHFSTHCSTNEFYLS
jgi:hypothetical protein